MRKVLIAKNLLLVFALIFVVSCSKKSDEVTPSSLTGKWKQNGTTGKVSYTEKGVTVSNDINEVADNTIIEFKADGTGNFEGDAITYKAAGSILTVTFGGQPVEFTAKVSGNNLALGFTKDQFFKFIDLLGDPTDPDVIDLKKRTFTEFTYNINYIKQ